MDTVQYLSNDWNNRNRIRTPTGSQWLTVPIDKFNTKGKRLDQVRIFGSNNPEKNKFWQRVHWRSIESNYRNCRYFDYYEPQLRKIYIDTIWERLIDLCWEQFQLFLNVLGFGECVVVRMSETEFEGQKGNLVLDQCIKLGADAVVFGAHGKEYVNIEKFDEHNINVYFQDYVHPTYDQQFSKFVPNLSVLDLIMNHGPRSKDILLSCNVTYEGLREGRLWSL